MSADVVDFAVESLARGRMIVVTDDEGREDEGDLVMAASLADAESVAFMIRHTSGIVCAPLPSAIAERLELPPMVSSNDAPLRTAFTVSVDVREGLSTGISAAERSATLRRLAHPEAHPSDFARPGHVFPLAAREGGTLFRSGHTEAAVDLCRAAGVAPVGAIAELVRDDGRVAKGDEVLDFARRHELATLSIADLIAWRQAREKLVRRRSEKRMRTPVGEAVVVSYTTPFDRMRHMAAIFGDIKDGRDVPTCIHRERGVEDVFGSHRALSDAMEWIAEQGRGVLVYLREHAAGTAPFVESDDDHERGENDENHAEGRRRRSTWRQVGLGAQILSDLGTRSIRLRSRGAREYVGLGGFGIEIASTDSEETS